MSKDQKDYWEKKIVGWEDTIYSQKKSLKSSILEKAASRFRGILKKRMSVAESLIAPHLKGKIVMDLGCGSAVLIQKLIKYKPKQIIGIDIAEPAIELAKNKFKDFKAAKAIKFICADVRKDQKILKGAEIVIGVGFIDYFNSEELLKLLKNLNNKKFLLSFPEKIISSREILHKIYLNLASCPGSYKYSKEEMDSLLKRAGIKTWWYYDKENIRFVTNLPEPD